MSRPQWFRLLVVVAVLATSLFYVLTTAPRLGLDLRGGTQITLQTQDSPTVVADAGSTDRTMEVLRRRVDALGVSEPTLVRSGETRIIVELPGVQDPREAAETIGRTAQLSFHPVLGAAGPEGSGPVGAEPVDGELVLPDESGVELRLAPASLTGEGVGAAAAVLGQQGVGWDVSVDFQGQGRVAWQALTAEAACAPPGDPQRRVAIVLDDEVVSSPQVDPSVACEAGIPGFTTSITGDFTQEEAADLAGLIEGGALPVPVEIIEQRTVGATLGATAINASALAAVIGVALTGLFMTAVYRLLGGIAVVALAGYGLIAYAALLAVGATLTLPGLAGFVLAIGMAVDANVLVYERAREEYQRRGKGLVDATRRGFSGAWTAIVDSNVTTLLAAGLLFVLASGPVRGFGVTLSIGVLASMFSALVLTRVLAETAVGTRWLQRRPGASGISRLGPVREWLTRRDPDLMRHGRRLLVGAVVAVLVAGAGIAVRGLDLGVEFTGGRLLEYQSDVAATDGADVAGDVRAAVAEAGFPQAVVQAGGDGVVAVRTGVIDNDEAVVVEDAVDEATAGELEKVRDELIGPSLGSELQRNALVALGVALLAQLAYLAVRFRWTFAASSVLAMVHDVAIVVGVFAWLGRPVDGVFLAALLTVIGYSVNDSVVIFDRVRELWRGAGGGPFSSVVNQAVVQTLPRTVNTGIGAGVILLALAVLGGDSLTDFALALLIGVVVGSYSSLFVASPLAVALEGRWPTPPPAPRTRKVARDPMDSGAVV
ncbi:protein translocase subunit SecD [Aquipuribacter sp. MA13-6]|uniref:protein translocase subunit SecD n=1 Tax=unclassified Aquipuribacter TaxID=2635084 RepID=UPI003EEA6EDD